MTCPLKSGFFCTQLDLITSNQNSPSKKIGILIIFVHFFHNALEKSSRHGQQHHSSRRLIFFINQNNMYNFSQWGVDFFFKYLGFGKKFGIKAMSSLLTYCWFISAHFYKWLFFNFQKKIKIYRLPGWQGVTENPQLPSQCTSSLGRIVKKKMLGKVCLTFSDEQQLFWRRPEKVAFWEQIPRKKVTFTNIKLGRGKNDLNTNKTHILKNGRKNVFWKMEKNLKEQWFKRFFLQMYKFFISCKLASSPQCKL